MSGYISKPVDSQIYTVSKMIRSGMNSGYWAQCDYVGLRAALRAGRDWMERHPDYYFTIERKLRPFVEGRARHCRAPDRLCMTGYAAVTGLMSGPIDAPDYIAAGSFVPFGDGADCEQSIASRGRWI